MNREEENKALAELNRLGYTILVSNPHAEKFNVRYTVYQPSNRIEGKLVVLDEKGNITAEQG